MEKEHELCMPVLVCVPVCECLGQVVYTPEQYRNNRIYLYLCEPYTRSNVNLVWEKEGIRRSFAAFSAMSMNRTVW